MIRKARWLLVGCTLCAALLCLLLPSSAQPPNTSEDPLFSTFSLVAYDPAAQEWGVVVTSKVPSLRNIVPWAKAGVGAVATQASTNRQFGPDGLAWLAKGKSPEEIAKIFQDSDAKIDVRQFGIVDAKGNSISFTGKKCGVWAGHKIGKNYACQGNILVGEAVVIDTAKTFEEAKGSLALRLMAALEAGNKAGGDKRTTKIQSSALIVVRDNSGGQGGVADYVIDLKVDKSTSPVEDLRKLLTEKLAQEIKKDQKKVEKQPPMPSIPPTHGNVSYGKHERNVMDFWQAKSEKPTPIVICIHGGSWIGGDKSAYYSRVKTFLDVGISMATINYRLMKQANEEKVVPPVKAPLEDAARAVQFVRSKASAWNIDKKRIGATGGSAGGASTLWLAFHDDMADPRSNDPIARESTRLYCAAVDGAQTSLDPKELLEWMPNYSYGAQAFGLKNIQEMVEQRDKILPWIKKYSAIELVTKDDPPIGLYYGGVKGAKRGEYHPDPTHSPMLGLLLAERLKQVGVEHVMVYVDQPNKLPNANAFLMEYLKK